MQIKIQLGKLTLPAPLEEIVETQIREKHIQLLNIELLHILGLSGLQPHHKDPFDRLLISQAIGEQIVLLTNDPQFKAYPVTALW